jgi:signal transduction histidine kinase/ligand-binding sensor domain-containing protein
MPLPSTGPKPLSFYCIPRYSYLAYIWGMLVFTPLLSATQTYYHVDNWTTENGLPQNVIRGLCQAPDGYLWLATMDGMVRFDGVRFVTFNRSNTPGILGNRFTSLRCLANGDLWAGTETSGITRFSGGRFKTYTAHDGLPYDDVYDVMTGDNGEVWALSSKTIVRWNSGTSRFEEVKDEEAKFRYFGNYGFGFWATDGARVLSFKKGGFTRYPLPHDWPRGSLVSFGENVSGDLFVANANGKFSRLGSDEPLKKKSDNEALGQPQERDLYRSTYRDHLGDLLTIETRYDRGGFLAQSLLVKVSGQEQSIPFSVLFDDQEGSIWLATDGHGLYRLRRQTISVLSSKDGLPAPNVYPIFQDHLGNVWIGTWAGGLARYSAGKITTFSNAQGLRDSQIDSIYEDREGTVWVASRLLYRLRGEQFEAVDNQLLREHGVIRVIYQDGTGGMWFGTEQGVIRFQNGIWSTVTTKDGLATDDVRVIISARGGGVWVGGYGGLTRISGGHLERWTEKDGLPSNTIRSLYEDQDGALWIGTYDGGLGRLEQGSLTRFSMADGLFNNGVFQILEDSRGYLWMSCNRGIYRVAKRELTDFANHRRNNISSIAYGKDDGMLNAECNGGLWPAGIRAKDGTLWFPTQDGVALVRPDEVQINLRPPPVMIESVLLDREPMPIDTPIRISPRRQNLQIEYTALSFIDSPQIKFKYKLTPLDSDWVDASTRRIAYYSHLPPGEYEFQVIAANSDGIWNLEGKRLHVSVLPHFYQTWWFLAACFLAAAGAIYLAWQYRVAQYKHAQAMQQDFSRKLIVSQEQERKRIAGELHDSLGQHLLIIKNWASLALTELSESLNGPKVTEEALSEIANTAGQAIHEVRGIAYNLRPYQLERLGLTTALLDLISQVEAASSICFQVQVDRLDGAFAPEAEIGIYRIVQECLNNIVRHSHASEARVTILREARGVKLSIDDNGCGFTASETKSTPAERGGFGLLGIAERVRIAGGEFAVHSAPGSGTKISISIKTQGAEA